MNLLTDRLRDRIRKEGSLSFAEFMAAALYDPAEGYYGAGRARVGREGDFMTSVSVGPLFGRLLARQFTEMWELLGRPPTFRLTEQGAHDGRLAEDILTGLRDFAPACAEAVELCLIEPTAHWAQAQRERLAGQKRVRWVGTASELPEGDGVFYANELLDAFPVERLRWRDGAWREMRVSWREDQFVFEEGAPAAAALTAHLPAGLPDGYTTEVRPGLEKWTRESAATLRRGWLLAIDYGYAREEYYRPERSDGTLSAYAEHRRVEDPLETPGAIDLTAHVDFTSLLEAAPGAGLELAGWTDQQRFIAGLGRLHFEDTATVTPARAKEQRAFISLLHPGLLGAAFHVVCLARKVPAGAPLAGFHFAGGSGLALA